MVARRRPLLPARTLVPTLVGRTAAAQQVKRQTEQVPFADLVARASSEVQEFERRLLTWVDERGWQSATTAAARRVLTPEGLYVLTAHRS